MSSALPTERPVTVSPPRRSPLVAASIAAGTLGVLALGGFLFWRSRSQINDVALASTAKAVTVVEARSEDYKPQRHYVATVQPWVQAAVGPQFIAAYADTVLVRPGDPVKRGQILATLDCRDASAQQRAIAMQARAIDAKQRALANEAGRINSLVDSGFAAPNDAEQKLAGSASVTVDLTFVPSVSARLSAPDTFMKPAP